MKPSKYDRKIPRESKVSRIPTATQIPVDVPAPVASQYGDALNIFPRIHGDPKTQADLAASIKRAFDKMKGQGVHAVSVSLGVPLVRNANTRTRPDAPKSNICPPPQIPARARANAVRDKILAARVRAAGPFTGLSDAMRRCTAQANEAFSDMASTIRDSSVSMDQMRKAFYDAHKGASNAHLPPPGPPPIEKE